METLKWSRPQISQDFSNCECLSEMISHVEKRLVESQQVVCQIKVNDMLLKGDDEKTFAGTKRDEIESLEISYRKSEFLLRDTLESLAVWVTEFKNAVVQTAEKVRGAEVTATAYAFTKVITSAEWFIDALQAIKGHVPATSEWQSCEDRFIAALKELEGGYRAQDNILVADVLEYEISSSLDQWREILSKVASA